MTATTEAVSTATGTPPAPPAKTKPLASRTEYVVLTSGDDGLWKVGPAVHARSADEAIRSGSANIPGTYIAVPARSWKPVTVTVETVSRVKLESA